MPWANISLSVSKTLQAKVENRSIPFPAFFLGGLGVLPFLGCAAVILLGQSDLIEKASGALVAYGAVILSFLGGIQWGFATGYSHSANQNWALLRRLLTSVLPALVAWVGLLAPQETSFLFLSGAFLLVLIADIRAARSNEAPAWYPLLRWPLTLIVIVSLLTVAVA